MQHSVQKTHSFVSNINGITVQAHYSEDSVNRIFLPFLHSMTGLQKQLGRRILIMLAAPPGAGKTTLAGYLEFLSSQYEDLEPVQAIGIDGFHRYQDDLLSHTIIRNGEEIPLVKIKGAPVTFDLSALTERIRMLASGSVCDWPVYDRLLHNPIDHVIRVDKQIILLEGNYLLLDEDGWRDLNKFADYTVLIRADEDLLRQRLIRRRIQTGVAEDAAEAFVDYSDMVNVRLCLNKSLPADLTLQIDPDDNYHIL